MLKNAKFLKGFKIEASDGDIGTVSELFFDDERWVVRYLVVNTGNWLNRKEVLLSPISIEGVDWENKGIRVRHTIREVEQSPAVDTDMPVSRQKEVEFHKYYGWAPYWGLSTIWAAGGFPTVYPWQPNDRDKSMELVHKVPGNQHLRSIGEVIGYHIQATDSAFGHIEDFVVDTDSWSIRYLVIDTVNYWPSKSVLVSPEWISRVSWAERKVFTELSTAHIKNSPEYLPDHPLPREYEDRLYNHYNKPRYWDRDEDQQPIRKVL